MSYFQLTSNYAPSGDQPQAIKSLVSNLKNNTKDQVLLGVTGSGKTFTIANVIIISEIAANITAIEGMLLLK